MKKKEFEQTFIVDRALWKNSHTFPGTSSELLTQTEDGLQTMCCLGFVCNQLGIPKQDLLYRSTPLCLEGRWTIPYLIMEKRSKMGEDYWTDSELSDDAIQINDDNSIAPKDKEKKLKELFAKHNLGIKFIGKYVKP